MPVRMTGEQETTDSIFTFTIDAKDSADDSDFCFPVCMCGSACACVCEFLVGPAAMEEEEEESGRFDVPPRALDLLVALVRFMIAGESKSSSSNSNSHVRKRCCCCCCCCS